MLKATQKNNIYIYKKIHKALKLSSQMCFISQGFECTQGHLLVNGNMVQENICHECDSFKMLHGL